MDFDEKTLKMGNFKAKIAKKICNLVKNNKYITNNTTNCLKTGSKSTKNGYKTEKSSIFGYKSDQKSTHFNIRANHSNIYAKICSRGWF